MYLYLKAFHIISMVAWFAGLFYLPRLFVYHTKTQDQISLDRFKIMEGRLYYGITWPAALLTTVLGLWLISLDMSYYLKSGWMHAKLLFVVLLWVYHLMNGHYLRQFKAGINKRTTLFYRVFNEIPTVFLILIVLLAVVKPI